MYSVGTTNLSGTHLQQHAAGRPTTEAARDRPQKRPRSAAPAAPAIPDQMEDDRVSDNDYDYEYEDDEDFDDDNMMGADSAGGGASGGGGSGKGKGAGGAAPSAAEAEVDLALRDETTVAFIDHDQLKLLMSKVVSDIR